MKNKTIIFLDIDGTIYSPRHGIPASTVEAVDRLKANGHHPVVCTGRTKSMIFPEILELGFDGIIAGAGAYGEWEKDILFNDTIDKEESAALVGNFVRFGFNPFSEGAEHIYYHPQTTEDPAGDIKRIFSLTDPAILRQYDENVTEIAKVSGGFKEGSDEDGFIATLGGRYNVINHHNILLETIPRWQTKERGVRRMIELLGADMENTYGYGDSFNDYEMLTSVKYGVCMGNGDPRLLEKIPLHAKRMEEDGLYLSLKEFGLI